MLQLVVLIIGGKRMDVEFIASSTMMINHGAVSVLTDPWLIDGAYYGSWAHYPSLKTRTEDLYPSHIYISHIHQDHCDVFTLSKLPERPPVVICNFKDKRLKTLIESLGFPVHELTSGEKLSLSDDLNVYVYSTPVCDILHCGAVIPCEINIDSLAVFETSEGVVFNTNDHRFIFNLAKELLEKHGIPDVAFLGHTGAGPFPQCFEIDDEQKRKYADRKKNQFLKQAGCYADIWKPRLVVPFAGAYHLQGVLSDKNSYRGASSPEEAKDYLNDITLSCNMLEGDVLNVHSLELETKKRHSMYHPENQTYCYEHVTNIFKQNGFPNLSKLAIKARENLWIRQQKTGYYSDWTVEFVTEIERFNFRFDESVLNGDHTSKLLRITADHSMMWGIMTGLFNYYDAHLGSHLTFHEDPLVYDMNLFGHLPFFKAF